MAAFQNLWYNKFIPVRQNDGEKRGVDRMALFGLAFLTENPRWKTKTVFHRGFLL